MVQKLAVLYLHRKAKGVESAKYIHIRFVVNMKKGENMWLIKTNEPGIAVAAVTAI